MTKKILCAYCHSDMTAIDKDDLTLYFCSLECGHSHSYLTKHQAEIVFKAFERMWHKYFEEQEKKK